MTEQTNNAPAEPIDGPDLNEQMIVRREKRERLLAEGKKAYAIGVGRTHTLAEVREAYEDKLEAGDETQDVVTVAGR
ncbi:MAG TPA: lysine--tRNA ligase, partial [Nocardioides sp.]